MINIKRVARSVALCGKFRRVPPLAALAAATGVAGCVAYPYQRGPGYHETYYHTQPYYAAQPPYASH